MHFLEKNGFLYWKHEGYYLVIVEGLVEIKRESPYNKTIAWTHTLDEAKQKISELKKQLR